MNPSSGLQPNWAVREGIPINLAVVIGLLGIEPSVLTFLDLIFINMIVCFQSYIILINLT